MANIRISPDQMRDRAASFTNYANEVQSVITGMDSLLNALQGEWEGEASRSFSDRFAELRPGFVKAQELIEEISRTLTVTAQSMEETDRNLAGKM